MPQATKKPVEKPQELITPEAALVIKQIRDYLQSPEITQVVISTDEQCAHAAELGNELQKKRSALEKTRVAEKAPYDAKAKEVQALFLPVLTAIDQKKAVLGKAIQDYHFAIENKAKQDMAKAQIEWKKEMDDLEAKALSDESKAADLRKRASEAYAEAQSIGPTGKGFNQAMQRSRDFTARAEMWEAKANNKREIVQAPPPPPVVAPPPKPTGTRVSKSYSITVTDKAEFIRHVCSTCEWHLLEINEKALKDEAKNSEGQKRRPGIMATAEENYGFSGR
jgi:hypothetical protein